MEIHYTARMRTTDPDILDFASRLREAAEVRGKTSGRAKSGVDLAAMAKAAGVSFELARRYADGLAMPKPRVVRALSEWLGVQTDWLLFGSGPREAEPELNLGLLEACITAVDEAQSIAGVRLPSARSAPLMAELYRNALVGVPPSSRSVAAVIRAFI